MTLEQAVETAKKITNRAASVKDWRLTTNRDRAMKKLAAEISQGKGYILASPRQIAEQYPNLVSPYFATGAGADRVFIWAVGLTFKKTVSSSSRRELNFMPIR